MSRDTARARRASAARQGADPTVKEEVEAPAPLVREKVIKLQIPIEFAGEEYHQLTVRRLKAKDFRQLDMMEGGGQAAAIAMVALVCNVEDGVIDELDAVDYLTVQETIADFFPKELAAKLLSMGRT